MRIRLKVCLALGVVLLSIGIGTVVLYCVEKLDWIDSVYFSVLSVTTVGYGDRAFKTFHWRLFACVWLLFLTLMVARAFLYLAEARIDKRHRRVANWVLHRKITVEDLLAADINNSGFLSAEFIRWPTVGRYKVDVASFESLALSVLQAIEKRISKFSQVPIENGELIQVLRYEPNQFYRPHHDYFSDSFNLMHGGQRVATMLMCLTNNVEGGETFFPMAGSGECSCGGKMVKGLCVKPNRGDAVLFWSMICFSRLLDIYDFFK